MNTTENNKLLAEFLGYVNTTPTDKDFNIYELKGGKLGRFIEATSMKFHNDWRWIMAVVEKIEEIETKDGRTFTIDIHKDNVIINQYGKYNNEIIVTEGGTRLENLYNACVKFVEWYNKEQSNNTVINSLDEWAKSGFAGIETMFGGK